MLRKYKGEEILIHHFPYIQPDERDVENYNEQIFES